ncbi:MAG: hypothetical protein ACUVQY_04240 [Thermoproteota archaeon]
MKFSQSSPSSSEIAVVRGDAPRARRVVPYHKEAAYGGDSLYGGWGKGGNEAHEFLEELWQKGNCFITRSIF